MTLIYENGLGTNAANHVPLTPLSFIRRTAAVYPDRTAVIHGQIRRTWAETHARSRRLASALARHGVGRDSTVAVMAPNIPEMVEAHFGVPMAGAVLNAINTRLDAAAVAFILGHGEASVLLTDTEFAPVIEDALAMLGKRPLVIDIDDPEGPGGRRLGQMTYEEFLSTGDETFEPVMPDDEWQAIALNYTSGTTGDPKGVVYHHRGAYLNALGNSVSWSMGQFPVYLWTLPMFHCNGWCFPWTVTALAGTHVCLRRVEAPAIFDAFSRHGVTHLCGAPIVMSMLSNAPADQRPDWPQKIRMMTAGAAPPAAVIEGMEGMGVDVTHVYGLLRVAGGGVLRGPGPGGGRDGLLFDECARLGGCRGVGGAGVTGGQRARSAKRIAVKGSIGLPTLGVDGAKRTAGRRANRSSLLLSEVPRSPTQTLRFDAANVHSPPEAAACSSCSTKPALSGQALRGDRRHLLVGDVSWRYSAAAGTLSGMAEQ